MNNTFGKPIIPDNEALRLKALRYHITLQELPERFFNHLANIVARTFNTPIALISIVEEDEVFFKGNIGMEETKSTDRGVSLCSLAVLQADPLIFNDAIEEPCLLSNPLVAGEFGLRFYAGAPITTPEGFHIGTVCVVDKQPREFSEDDKQLLVEFAKNAMSLIQLHSSVKETAVIQMHTQLTVSTDSE
jgi:GAF domain-containing protein